MKGETPFGVLNKRIYICHVESGELKEPAGVNLPVGFALYGGIDCAANGAYLGTDVREKLTAGSDAIPLSIVGYESRAEVHNVHVVAENAMLPGRSSIAVLTDAARVDFINTTLEAGNGANGAAGGTPTDPVAAGSTGDNGDNGCTADFILGPIGKINPCDFGLKSVGGSGGHSANVGLQGLPDYGNNAGDGSDEAACSDGGDGDPGPAGMNGSDGVGLGSIDEMGYHGVPGSAGSPGLPGQGGGGGGGAPNGNVCTAGQPTGSPAGGSGATGGCGGAGGFGGGHGGASIALLSLKTDVHFENTKLIAAMVGIGGSGGTGQDGAVGGGILIDEVLKGSLGGVGSPSSGCKGGAGGMGGKGGAGGKGADGYSIGIAYRGSAPDIGGIVEFVYANSKDGAPSPLIATQLFQ